MKIDFNTPIKTTYCVNEEQRLSNIEYSTKTIKQRIQPDVVSTNEKVAIVCFGPSLNETWSLIKDFKYIITCSGAHKFLIEKGIIPTWHVDVDPREHKVELLGKPHKDVEYLLATTVHPSLIDAVKDYNVKLWNVFPDTVLQKLPNHVARGEWVFTGGSTVGLRCLTIARFLGFKNLHIFGMDCSYPDNYQGEHTTIHPNPVKPSNRIQVDFDGVTYNTTPSLLSYAKEYFAQKDTLVDCEMYFYGHGLLQHMIQSHWTPPEGSVQKDQGVVAVFVPELYTDHYIHLNKLLHLQNPSYGASGYKRTQTVVDLTKKYNTTDVLDYGCGKGTLAQNLPFPINEYDPAIQGKDKEPFPADVVVCSDVLEHIEPEFLDNVLGDLQRLVKQVGYFVIHMGPAIKQLPDGRNTHLIQQNRPWWWKKIDQYFEIDEMEEHGQELHVFAKPKHKHQQEQQLGNKLLFSCFENDGVKFNVVNGYTQWRAETLLTKEPVTIDWINSFNSGEVFVDIGANVGSYSLLAAKKGANVYAFEPESQNYALLNQNIFVNGFKNIRAFCLAVSDTMNIAELNLAEFTPGASCHQFDTTKDHNEVETTFQFQQGCFSIPLDALVDLGLIPQPDHIKIDVDGIEPLVIKGARETLLRTKTLLVEVNTNLQSHQDMIEQLVGIGFVYNVNQVSSSLRKQGPFKGVGEYVFRRNRP